MENSRPTIAITISRPIIAATKAKPMPMILSAIRLGSTPKHILAPTAMRRLSIIRMNTVIAKRISAWILSTPKAQTGTAVKEGSLSSIKAYKPMARTPRPSSTLRTTTPVSGNAITTGISPLPKSGMEDMARSSTERAPAQVVTSPQSPSAYRKKPNDFISHSAIFFILPRRSMINWRISASNGWC